MASLISHERRIRIIERMISSAANTSSIASTFDTLKRLHIVELLQCENFYGYTIASLAFRADWSKEPEQYLTIMDSPFIMLSYCTTGYRHSSNHVMLYSRFVVEISCINEDSHNSDLYELCSYEKLTPYLMQAVLCNTSLAETLRISHYFDKYLAARPPIEQRFEYEDQR